MPHRTIVIAFEFPEDGQIRYEQNLLGRVRDFEEMLEQELSERGEATVHIGNLDVVKPQLRLTLSSDHHAGVVLRFIHKKLKRHNLAELARVYKIEPSATSEGN